MGTILELDGPPAYEFGSASSISGTGTVAVAGTVMTEDGTYDLGGETQVTGGGTLTFNSDATITDLGSDLEIYYGSTVNIASGQSFSIASVLLATAAGRSQAAEAAHGHGFDDLGWGNDLRIQHADDCGWARA